MRPGAMADPHVSRQLTRFFCTWLFFLAGLPREGHAMTYRYRMLRFDKVFDFLIYDFGLAPGAHISGELYNEDPVEGAYLMIFTYKQWHAWRRQDPPQLPGRWLRYDSHLVSYWRKPLTNDTSFDFHLDSPEPNRYFVGVFNSHRRELRMHGELTLTNPGGQELPLEFVDVPGVLLVTGRLFLVSAAVLVLLLCTVWRRGRTAMHLVMFLVVVLKGTALLLQWRDRKRLSATGEDGGVGEVVWQLLDKAQDISELMMFLLIALGWKVLRGSLNITEVRFAVGVSVISFYLGVFEVACTTNSQCSGYQLSRYILRSLCYLVVIVAMNFNLQVVHAQIADAPASLEVGKHYWKFRAYTVFRWVFLAFIIAPTLELFLVSAMPWDAMWVYVLIQNLRTWAIYSCVIIAFRPGPHPLRVLELTVRRGEDETDGEEDEDEDAESGDVGAVAAGGRIDASTFELE